MSESPAQVLIVDDDRFIQRFLADHLGRLGFQVAVERDGEWALETFAQRSFDAVILDLHLPGISGYDVARKLRSSPRGKSTPIVMISGVYRNALHRQEALEKHGASAFLEKPISLPALEQALRAAVGDRYPSPPETLLPARGPGERAEPLADASARDEASQVEQAARTVAAFPSLRGSLETKPFPELLAEIHRWRATGALLLRREKVKKIVYFQGGAPQYVKSNLLSECLGRLLVKERMISEAQCEESLRRMKASGRQQGTVLIEQGALSPQNLVYALTLQLREKLFEVFAWESGDFQFSPKVARPRRDDRARAQPGGDHLRGRAPHLRRAPARPRARRRRPRVPRSGRRRALRAPAARPRRRGAHAARGDRRPPLGRHPARARAALGPRDRPADLRAQVRGDDLGSIPAARTSAPKISFAEPIPIELEESAQVLAFPKRTATPRPGSFEPVRTSLDEGGLLPELSWPHGQSSDAALERERLAAKVAALRKMDYFQILGVPTNAPKDAIEKAFLALAREHHPDRHRPFASAETQQLVEQIYQLLQAAHDTLVDATERARYAERMTRGAPGGLRRRRRADPRGRGPLPARRGAAPAEEAARGARVLPGGRPPLRSGGRVPRLPRLVAVPRPPRRPDRDLRRAARPRPGDRAQPEGRPGLPVHRPRLQGDRPAEGRRAPLREGDPVQPGLHRGAPRALDPRVRRADARPEVRRAAQPGRNFPTRCVRVR